MQFTLVKTIVNVVPTPNQDGTTTVNGAFAQISIVGSPTGKFLQNDEIKPVIIIPADIPTSGQMAYITEQAQAYVTKNYPNS